MWPRLSRFGLYRGGCATRGSWIDGSLRGHLLCRWYTGRSQGRPAGATPVGISSDPQGGRSVASQALVVLGSDGLRQHLSQHMPMHIGQAALDPIVVVAEPLVIDPQKMQQRCVQVVDRGHVLDRFRGVAQTWLCTSG